MKLRKIISVLLVAVLTLSLAVSCGEDKQLATPENLAVSAEGLVTWSAVENATGYVVKVNDDEYTVTETQYRRSRVLRFPSAPPQKATKTPRLPKRPTPRPPSIPWLSKPPTT